MQAVVDQSTPDRPKNRRRQTTEVTDSDQQSASLPGEGKTADKSRRLIPDWFRLGQDKDSVPLPTTPRSDTASAATGPFEQFQ